MPGEDRQLPALPSNIREATLDGVLSGSFLFYFSHDNFYNSVGIPTNFPYAKPAKDDSIEDLLQRLLQQQPLKLWPSSGEIRLTNQAQPAQKQSINIKAAGDWLVEFAWSTTCGASLINDTKEYPAIHQTSCH